MPGATTTSDLAVAVEENARRAATALKAEELFVRWLTDPARLPGLLSEVRTQTWTRCTPHERPSMGQWSH